MIAADAVAVLVFSPCASCGSIVLTIAPPNGPRKPPAYSGHSRAVGVGSGTGSGYGRAPMCTAVRVADPRPHLSPLLGERHCSTTAATHSVP